MHNFINFTHPQKRILFSEVLFPDFEMSNVGYLIKISKSLDFNKLEQSINDLIRNNCGSRLRLKLTEDGIEQYIWDYKPFSVDHQDLTGKTDKDIYRFFKTIHDRKLDLYESPLFYFMIVKFSGNESGFYIKAHHLVADGTSADIAINDIVSSYLETSSNAPEQRVCYFDYLNTEKEYESSKRFSYDRDYWKKTYLTMPQEAKLSVSHFKNNVSEIKRKYYDFPQSISNKILKHRDERKTSLFSVFLQALSLYIYKATENTDFTIAIPTHNRIKREYKNCLGMFVSTMPFRVIIDPDSSLSDFESEINKNLISDLRHQRYPFNTFIRDLREKHAEVVDFLNIQLVEVPELSCSHAEVFYHFSPRHSSSEISFYINLRNRLKYGILGLSIDFKRDIYPDSEIDCIFNRIVHIIDQIVSQSCNKIDELDIIPDSEKRTVLEKFNKPSNMNAIKSPIDLFKEIVKSNKHNIAVEQDGLTLSYLELDRRTDLLSSAIRKRCSSKISARICIFNKNSIETVVGILSVLKAGYAYLPIDPDYSGERISYILDDASADLILTSGEYIKKFSDKYCVLDLKGDYSEYEGFVSYPEYDQNNSAYVIYTSGSTGNPKGVEVTLGNLINYIKWGISYYHLDEPLVFPLYSSISFDLTVTSIFLPLCSGGKVVVYQSPNFEDYFFRIFEEDSVNTVKLTPSHMKILLSMEYSGKKISQLIVGGEELSSELASSVRKKFKFPPRIINEYGPTEATVGCSVYEYDPDTDMSGPLAIGKPIENTQILILNGKKQLMPPGTAGEICISGCGVAKGYLNSPEKTREKFIENPYFSGRIYKSGDLGYWDYDGNLRYIGRSDRQVKIRGFRIELDEITLSMRKFHSVIDAVAVDRKTENGEKAIFGYYVSQVLIDPKELDDHLRRILPDYMIPLRYQHIEKIPLTVNGKLDKTRLPDIRSAVVNSISTASAPSTHYEEALHMSWQEVFNISEISVTDNFFELGGDSIKAIQVVSNMLSRGYKLSVKNILDNLTIRSISRYVTKTGDEKSDLTPLKGARPLLPAENWFFSLKQKNENWYNHVILLSFNKKPDITALRKSFKDILWHHDGLRQNYEQVPPQAFYNREHLLEDFEIHFEGISYSGEAEKDYRISEIKKKYGSEFDISRGLLIRVIIIKDSVTGHEYMMMIAHHLVTDGISWRIILNDLYKIYTHYEEQSVSYPWRSKTGSTAQYYKYLSQIYQGMFSEKKATADKFKNEESLTPLLDTADISYINSGKATAKITREKSGYFLKNLISDHSIDMELVIILAFYRAYSDIFNTESMSIEIENHGRGPGDIDISQTVGWFTMIGSATVSIGKKDIDSQIISLKKILKESQDNLKVSFLRNYHNNIPDKSISNVRFNYLGQFSDSLNTSQFSYEPGYSGIDSDPANDLSVYFEIDSVVVNSLLNISLTYPCKVSNSALAERIMNRMKEELDSIYLYLESSKKKYLTGSDFETVELSDDDMESLFE